MTTDESPVKHYITLTKAQYEALVRLTSGDPELQTDRTKSLREELDYAQVGSSNRYHVRFTSQNLDTAAYVLQVHGLRNGNACYNRLIREYGHLMGPTSD